MKDMQAVKERAVTALADAEYEDALAAASELVAAGEPWLLDGLVGRALTLESWLSGPSDRLILAAADWQRMAEMAPAAVSYVGLARVLMKLGNREAAYSSLLEAKRYACTPEVLLAFAHYYRTAEPPDLSRAKAYFLRAALKGRTQGIRGYVEVAYELDQPYAAAAMVLIGLLATPVLALMFGTRRHAGF